MSQPLELVSLPAHAASIKGNPEDGPSSLAPSTSQTLNRVSIGPSKDSSSTSNRDPHHPRANSSNHAASELEISVAGAQPSEVVSSQQLFDEFPNPTKKTTAIIILTAGGIAFASSTLAGVLTVAITTIANDVQLAPGLLLWPSSIYALVCGCTLLICGTLSDAFGAKRITILGGVLQAIFTMASGLSRNGTEFIVFRGISGLAQSFCLPGATSVITSNLPTGRRRNVAFACMGGAQPIGFSLGLTLGGLLTDTIGWRWAFHMTAIVSLGLSVAACFLPPDTQSLRSITATSLRKDIDWIGALIISTSLALLSYVFASITTSTASIAHPLNLSLLVLALILLPTFTFWCHYQTSHNRPALIPNRLWLSRHFSVISLTCFFVWGAFNAFEQTLTLYILQLQKISPAETSLRFLPEPITGVLVNIAVGALVHRVRADLMTTIGIAISTIPPVLMAVAGVDWSYWRAEFTSMLLLAAAADCLFTVSNLVITSSFRKSEQGLAGGVFQTVSQIGKSIGVASGAVIANSVGGLDNAAASMSEEERLRGLEKGYKAAFWACVAAYAVGLLLSWGGLRGIGRVGLKRE